MEHDRKSIAPDDESLGTIEQLNDRSELSTLYPHAHETWEGSELMTPEAREKKQRDEQVHISITIRRWFAVIGVLVPMPIIIFVLLINIGAKFLSGTNIGILLIPVLGVVGILMYISYRMIRFVNKIFYDHAIKAVPFITVLVLYLGLSLNALFLITEPLHRGDYVIDSLIISAAVVVMSIFYSAFLVMIWASPRLSSYKKVWCMILIATTIVLGTSLLYFT